MFQRLTKGATTKDKTASLASALRYSRAAEHLNSMPERFATVIQQYDAIDVEPAFRNDIYNVLSGAVEIAEAMVDPTFSAELAGEKIAIQMEIMARALRYLSSRPSAAGFAIMLPATGKIVGQYQTREEAENHLANLVNFGASSKCIVVPTKVLSQHAIQPRVQPRPTYQPPAQSSPMDFPLPGGILPEPHLEDTMHGAAPPPVKEPGPSLVDQASQLKEKDEIPIVRSSISSRIADLDSGLDEILGKKK